MKWLMTPGMIAKEVASYDNFFARIGKFLEMFPLAKKDCANTQRVESVQQW